MTAFLIRVRRTSRRPLRLGTTNVTNSGDGSVVDANDPIVKRDMSFYANNFVVLGIDEAGTFAGVETMNPNDAVSNLTAPASGTILFTAIELPKDFLVTSLTYVSGTQAAVAVITSQFAGIYTSDGTTLTKAGASLTDTGALAANTARTCTLSTAYRTVAAGVHYLAWLQVAGTAASLSGQLPFNAVVANLDATKQYATLAGQTVLGTTHALSALTAGNAIPYVKIA